MMGHPHGVLVGAVVKAADVAWGAFERLRPQKESDPVRDRCLQLQRAIHCQRSDNQRLGDALDTIQSLQKDVTSQSEGCPSDLYERLMKIVESPAFLEKLQNFHGNGKEKIGGPAIMDDEGVALVNTDAEDPSCWLWVMDDFVPNKGEEQCGLDNENYMIISQEDIVDGIAVFMAKYVASSPQAKSLSPEELQMTISREFATMDQNENNQEIVGCRQVCVYCSIMGIDVYGLFTYALILRAITKEVCAFGSIVVRSL